ncbi:MAG TPA: low-specificity L-threonine aldolase [Planctomycetota bacterium]|nr:low-specificity L-threonine aldolase [Planctomycetota bacterium]
MRPPETPVIDLRSDTVTRPDADMLAAMATAPLGDDVLGDDPTVAELERKAAEITGKEAGLFVPSGTMGNSIAIGALCRPGDEMIVDSSAHSYVFECAGAARLWGVQSRPLSGDRGAIPLEDIAAAIRPNDIHQPVTRLLILEQTSNLGGGRVLPLEYIQAAGSLCRDRELRFHIDGARIFNASVASGVPVREYAAPADTLMFCVSKGLGAPAGSLLVGDAETIGVARRLRKLLGGGLRQAGILAACGLHALEHHVRDLASDHRRANELAQALAPLEGRGIELLPPETNMVYVRLEGASIDDHRALAARLAARGVLCVALGARGLRFVFHRDIDDEALAQAERAIVDEISSAIAR